MKNIHDLRQVLSDQIDQLNANETTVPKANAIVRAIAAFLHSIRLQLEYAKLRGAAAETVILALENRAEK